MQTLKALIIFGAMFLGLSTNAAIPPLSDEDREAYSSHIITGVVETISVAIQQNGYHISDKIYTVTLIPTQVEKGDDNTTRISFTFWKAFTRPAGMCGPIGQYGMMKVGDQIRVYMQKNEGNTYQLIEPNGFDVL